MIGFADSNFCVKGLAHMAWQIQKKFWDMFEWSFKLWVRLITVLGYIYLGLFTIAITVLGVLRTLEFFNLLHLGLHYNTDDDQAFNASFFIVLFLLVLRATKDTDDIKKHLGI
jgi:fatty acid desaturase